MAGFGELLGQPLVSGALNLVTSIFQSLGAQGRRPAQYQPNTNRGGQNLPAGIRANLQPGEFQRFFGQGGTARPVTGGVTMPTPSRLNLDDVTRTQLQDEVNLAQRGETRDARLQGVIGNYQTALARGDQELGDAGGQARQALNEGRAGFDNARGVQAEALRGINRAEGDTKNLAAQSIASTAALVRDFKQQSASLMANMTSLRGETLANAKNQTAVLLADASQSVKNTADQTMSDTIAEMRAMGVPEAQIQNQVAQIAAEGQQQIGDMLREIGVAENARISQIEVETGNWISNLSQTSLSAFGGITSTAIGETARTLGNTAQSLTNLADSRARVGQVIAGLEDASANWQGSQTRAIADISAMRSQLALSGQIDLANMFEALEDPLVMLGPIVETAFSASMGLEEAEHNYAIQNYNVQNAEESIFYNSIYNQLSYYRQYADQRHAQRFNQRNFNRSLAFAWIPTAAGAAGGAVADDNDGGNGQPDYGTDTIGGPATSYQTGSSFDGGGDTFAF